MAQKIEFSAKFKRDYVALSAVVIFFAIVLSEVALAISIPAYLLREDAMALQVRRLRLLESFDGARYMADQVKSSGEGAAMEVRLISWNLNLLANYLREHAGSLSGDEIAALQKSVDDSRSILARINSGRSYCDERKLDVSVYLDSLIPASEVK